MASALRILTLFVSFASLQLSLASGGPGCPAPWGQASTEMRGMDMAGMDMAGMDMAVAAGVEGAATNPERPCDESAVPTGCTTMTPCVFAAIPEAALVHRPAGREPSRVVALLVMMPPSVVATPELPPPRA